MDTATDLSIDLTVTGMTCTSCSARIERRLNKMPGVQATVNYATATAHVEHNPSVSIDELVTTIEATGYRAIAPTETHGEVVDEIERAEERSIRLRLFVSAALALPVLLLSMVPPLQFPYWQWVAFALATPVVWWGAWPFHRAAWLNARHRAATMDTLISLGVLAAWLWSTWALLLGGAGGIDYTMSMEWFVPRGTMDDSAAMPHLYLEVAATVPVFILAGRWFELRAKRNGSAALRALLAMGAKDAMLLDGADPVTGEGGREVAVTASALRVDDVFVVRPGETIATDGVILFGSGAVDESMLTGESVPIEVVPGSAVTGATVNVSGRLVVRATRVGADTRLAQMGRLITAAQNGKAPVQRLADRISAVFVPIVIGLSLLTLAGWWIVTGDVQSAFTAAVAVLIIACPCALGLATPTALLVGTGRGAQLGIVIRGPEVLEDTRRVNTIALDKTGTITSGRMQLVGVTAVGDEVTVLSLVAALEHASEHPVARAIVEGAMARLHLTSSAELAAVESFASTAGLGVTGVVEGHAVAAGRPEWLADEWGVNVSDVSALAAATAEAANQGATIVAVSIDGIAAAVVTVSDTIKPTSAEAIADLRALGLRPVLITGDNRAAAESVAARVGIAASDVIAGVLPEGKVDEVQRLQREGAVVAMVGDGVNDAAALAIADLGLAMGTGTDAAIEASDLTLVSGDLRSAATAIRLSRRTLRTIRGNLWWAFGYNVAMIPLAMAGLLTPLLAGAAMALSSVFVVSNSLRLRTFR
ncbi:MAG: heavy metal translocating P-type ATPase [Actinobacteria bacterium]|nr:heavy metal translocating P-type ATPase [Actinomycetota bacterium]